MWGHPFFQGILSVVTWMPPQIHRPQIFRCLRWPEGHTYFPVVQCIGLLYSVLVQSRASPAQGCGQQPGQQPQPCPPLPPRPHPSQPGCAVSPVPSLELARAGLDKELSLAPLDYIVEGPSRLSVLEVGHGWGCWRGGSHHICKLASLLFRFIDQTGLLKIAIYNNTCDTLLQDLIYAPATHVCRSHESWSRLNVKILGTNNLKLNVIPYHYGYRTIGK